MQTRGTTLILTCATILSGCFHTMEAPVNFVSVDRADLGSYTVRAVSADGMVIGLRTQDNPKRGTLAFWAEAVRNELVAGKGYNLVKAEDVTAAPGRPGRLMQFAATDRGADFTYLLAVYVTDYSVLLAEAGGKKEAVAAREEDIRRCLLSAR